MKHLLTLLISCFLAFAANAQCDDFELFCGQSILLGNESTTNQLAGFNYSACEFSGANYAGNDVIVKYTRFSSDLENWISLWNRSGNAMHLFVFNDCPLTSGTATCIASSLNSPKSCGTPPQPLNYQTINLSGIEAGEYYIVVDVVNPAAIETNMTLSVSCEGLDCTQNRPLECGIKEGDNSTYANNSANYYSCGVTNPNSCFTSSNTQNGEGFNGSYTGPEELWDFTAPAAGTYTFTMAPVDGIDLELFALRECCITSTGGGGVFVITSDEATTCYNEDNCLRGSTNAAGEAEILEIALNEDESIVLVVDGFFGAEGPYTLEVNCDTFDCSDAIFLECGETIIDNTFNYSNSFNSSTYSLCPDFDSSNLPFDGNDVVFEVFKPDNNGYLNITMFHEQVESNNLSMFLFTECGEPVSCVVKGNILGSPNSQFGEFTQDNPPPLPAGTYYIVIDGAFSNIGGPFSITATCGRFDRFAATPIACGDDLTNQNNFSSLNNQSIVYSGPPPYAQAVRGGIAPERLYELELDVEQEVTIKLSDFDTNLDFDLFLLDECNPQDGIEFCVVGESHNEFGDESIGPVSLAAGRYYIVVEGNKQTNSISPSIGSFSISVDGCGLDLCDLVLPVNPTGNYIEFDDSLLPNPATSFTVTYPIDSADPLELMFDIESGTTPYFYCPQPGCYLICFNYINEQGQPDVCCIKYCASFKDSACNHKPIIHDYEDNESAETFTCSILCEAEATKGVVATGDSSYVTVIGDGVDETYQEDEVFTLPYGEYEICCYVYDEECDFWDVCCDIYCFPYIPPIERCDEPLFGATDQPNVYLRGFSDLSEFSITPNNGGVIIEDVLIGSPIATSFTQLTVLSPGTYKVCGPSETDNELCCQYFCWQDPQPSQDCIDIALQSDGTIVATCSNDEYIYQWSVIPPGCPDPLCFDFVYGDQLVYVPTQEGEYTICKTYNGCCGEREQCCETICIGNTFDPNNEDGEFDHCDDIFINYLGQENEDGAFGRFLYTGDQVGAEGARWEIWNPLFSPTTPYLQVAVGASADQFDTRDIDFHFTPDLLYYVCYSWIGEDGCREYCCIKVEFPSNCDNDTDYGGGGDLTFTYENQLTADEEIIFWTVSNDDNFYGSGNPFTYTYEEDGMYYVCCLRWNETLKCYSLCCTKYCIEDPIACGDEDGISFTWDQSAQSYNLSRLGGGSASDEWQIDVPIALFGTRIEDPTNFRPAEFGIQPGEQVVVSVKYRDQDGCVKICCKELCSSGPDDCEETCFENCCAGEDLSWLEEVKTIIYNEECITTSCNLDIRQGTKGDTCFYALPTRCSILDQPFPVVDCTGDTIFSVNYFIGFNIERFEAIEDLEVIWTCSNGNEPQCYEPPCDFENEIFCESFQEYQTDDLVTDQDGWSLAGNNASPTIRTEALANNFMSIGPLPAPQGAQLELNDTSLPAATLVLTYTVNVSTGNGHHATINNGQLDESLELNIVDLNDDGRLQMQVIANSTFESVYSPIQPQTGEYIYIELHLNKGSQQLQVYVNDNLLYDIADAGVFSFADFYADNRYNDTGRIGIDDICLSTCESCSDEFIYDPNTFEDCDGFTFNGFEPIGNGTLSHLFSYEGPETIEGAGVYELDEDTGQTSLVASDFTFTCELGKTYILCVYYLDDNGCRVYCCRKVNFAAECNNIIPLFTGTADDIRYQFEYTFLGDEETITDWAYYANGQSLPLEGETITEELTLNGVTEMTICCYVYDAMFKCYRVCCRRICISNPLNECDAITVDRNMDGTYTLSAAAGVEVLRWDIDLPSQYAGPIGSDNPQLFDPTSFSIPTGEEVIISVKYIDADGCIKVCCTSLCLSPLDVDCSLFVVTASENGSEWVLDFDDDTGVEGFSTVVTLPDGSMTDLSGTANSFAASSQGNYRVCRYYDNECDQQTECCTDLCLTLPVICSPLTFTVLDDTVFTFNHTITNGQLYEWGFGDGTTLIDGSNMVSHTYSSQPASYLVTLTVTDACGVSCTSTLQISIGEFLVTATATDLTCEELTDGSVSLAISGGTAPYDIDWLDGPDGELVWEDLMPGQYLVTVSDASGMDTMITVTLIAPMAPTYELAIRGTSCGADDGSLAVTITNEVPVESYILVDADEFIQQNSTGLFEMLPASTYSISLIYADGCEVFELLDIATSEDIQFSIEDENVGCVTSTTIETGLPAELTYTWSLDGEVIAGADQPNLTVEQSGSYVVVASNGTCTKEDSAMINITPPSTYTIAATNTNCGASDGTITIESTNGIAIATVTITETGETYDGGTITDLAAGDYTLEIIDINGCSSNDFESIESSVGFEYSLGNDMVTCAQDVVTISSGLDVGSYELQWSLDSELLPANTADLLVTEPGTYTLAATDQTGCTVTESVYVAYYPELISVAGEEGTYSIGDQLGYSVDGAETITWQSSDLVLSCTDCADLELTVMQAGSLTLTSTDINGCTVAETFVISVDTELIFPNYMTPNGDNMNDVLEIVGLDGLTMTNLVVYNQAGRRVYETADYKNNWGGTDSGGEQLPDGAYYYSITYGIGDLQFTKVHDLTVLKNQ